MSSGFRVVLSEPGLMEMKTSEEPVDIPHEYTLGYSTVLCRPTRVGLCGTDYHAFKGQQPLFSYPRVIGHEIAVRVVAVEGAGTTQCDLKAGDLCAVEPYLHCGRCAPCRLLSTVSSAGQDRTVPKTNCCENVRVLGVHTDGGLCSLLRLPRHKLHVATGLSEEEAALVETLCIGHHAVKRARVTDRDRILIVGAGPIGMAIVQALPSLKEVAVLDVVESRLEFCLANLGVKKTIMLSGSIDDNLRTVFRGELPNIVFDATGNAKSMESCFNNVGHGGTIVFVGHTKSIISFQNPVFHQKELTVMGSRNATSEDFEEVIARIRAGRIDTKPWITHRLRVDEVKDSLERLADPAKGVIKAMVEL